MTDKICGLGVIGCGTFCDAYLRNLGPVYRNVRPVGCADLNTEAAQAAAARWNIPKVYTTEEMLADPEVDIVLILTNPGSHYSLTMQALKAGKHVYCEKPLATSLEQAHEIVAFAEEQGLFVGSAPDTFLSPEFQTVRKLIDDGQIGKVISVTANYVGPGADLWHPNPGFLYKKGGGPVLDMAPYFLTTLVSMLGPIEQLFFFANRGFDVRRIHGADVDVEVMTNYCGVLQFAGGAVGNINMSYDQWKSDLPGLEIYGTEGVIIAPDPNTMMGPVKLLKAAEDNSTVLYGTKGEMRIYDDPAHSIVVKLSDGTLQTYDVEQIQTNDNQTKSGVIDLWVDCLKEGRQPEISGASVLSAMRAVFASIQSAETGKTVEIEENK